MRQGETGEGDDRLGGWWDVWMSWWSGQVGGGAHLWGIPIFWWGRLGKVAQFTAGLVIVLDLVGSERLLHGAKYARQASAAFKRGLDSGFAGFWTDWYDDERRAGIQLGATIASVMAAGALLWRFVPYEGWQRILYWIYGLIAAPFAFLIGLLLLAFLLLALSFALLMVPSLVVARLVGEEVPGHPARWLALALFLAGFHFDLLAS
jgi:hypothetical protein